MLPSSKQHYYDRYWQEQDRARVSRRSEWRAEQLFSLVGMRYRSLLDIGAGQGELITYFRAAGYRVAGWDISPEAVSQLRNAGYSGEVVDLEADQFEGHYDVIACCEVLQQIEDPASVLRKASAVLLTGGRVFYSVPNEFHIVRRLGFGTPAESHIQLFSPRKAAELAEVSGYVVERKLYQPLVPPRWGKFWSRVGQALADMFPSLFSLSIMILAKRPNEE
ncbi:MAG: class I SAM-dependent methyltransferase [bacterium]|nr:class I SAM-dependent methyltransferase [bacterium]